MAGCAHIEVEHSICAACGACLHEFVLNGICHYCGEVNPEVTVKGEAPPVLVPAERLKRGK